MGRRSTIGPGSVGLESGEIVTSLGASLFLAALLDHLGVGVFEVDEARDPDLRLVALQVGDRTRVTRPPIADITPPEELDRLADAVIEEVGR